MSFDCQYVCICVHICESHTPADKMKSCILAVCMLVAAIAGAHAQFSAPRCPANFFIAEIVLTCDDIFPLSIIADRPDPDLTFFRNVLRFTDLEVERATEDALNFFNTRFGLDFSNITPDALSRRVIQNAIFNPIRIPINVTASVNTWLLNGNPRTSRCFTTLQGGYAVDFNGTQMLFGTYGNAGGAQGRMVQNGDSLIWNYYHIDVCAQAPLIIRVESNTPARVDPTDGLIIDSNDLYNRQLRQGLEQGLFVSIPQPPNFNTARLVTRRVLTFPDSLNLDP